MSEFTHRHHHDGDNRDAADDKAKKGDGGDATMNAQSRAASGFSSASGACLFTSLETQSKTANAVVVHIIVRGKTSGATPYSELPLI